jgi:hypothetical protein
MVCMLCDGLAVKCAVWMSAQKIYLVKVSWELLYGDLGSKRTSSRFQLRSE